MLLNPEMFESCEASSICLNGTSYDSNQKHKISQFSKDFGTLETKTKIEISAKNNQQRRGAFNKHSDNNTQLKNVINRDYESNYVTNGSLRGGDGISHYNKGQISQ